jgi:uncharacterized protein (TIGR03437 family)
MARVMSVSVNTASLMGQASAGPFSIVFALTDGSGTSDGNNTATISQVSFDGGSSAGSPILSGGATGSLAKGVTLTDTAFLNFSSEKFAPGKQLSFTVNLSDGNDEGSVPDRFTFYIEDNTGTPIPTLAASGDMLLGVDLSSANPASQTWNTDPARFPGASPATMLPMSICAVAAVTPAYNGLVSTVQPGSWITIYGSGLADNVYNWNNDFATSLGGVSVTVNGKAGYLLYVSPAQINLQAPDDGTTGPVSVVVTNATGTTTSSVTLAAVSPSLATLDGAHILAQIATPNGNGAYGQGAYDLAGPVNAFSFATRPVQAGETVVLWGVGFGPTTPALPAGQVVAGAAPTSQEVTVTIGGVTANVAFSGITLAGLYQLNVTAPTTASGDQPLIANVGGASTPAVMLTIR